jgi:prepilin-type processing-associated H-X9-DG protein
MDNPKPQRIIWREVAVCLFVLAIVNFVLFPQWSPSPEQRAKARRAICLSNLKQRSLAFTQYEQDNDGVAPNGLHFIGVASKRRPTGLGWANQIFEIAEDPQIFRCESDTTVAEPGAGDVISYAYNHDIALVPRSSRWKNPAKTVMLFEVSGVVAPLEKWPSRAQMAAGPLSAVGNGTELLTDGQFPQKVTLATDNIGGRPLLISSVPRHANGANYLLADGHVKNLSPDQVSSGDEATRSKDAQTGTIAGKAAGTLGPKYEVTFSTR